MTLAFKQPDPSQERYVADGGAIEYVVEHSASFGWMAHLMSPSRPPFNLLGFKRVHTKESAMAACQRDAGHNPD